MTSPVSLKIFDLLGFITTDFLYTSVCMSTHSRRVISVNSIISAEIFDNILNSLCQEKKPMRFIKLTVPSISKVSRETAVFNITHLYDIDVLLVSGRDAYCSLNILN